MGPTEVGSSRPLVVVADTAVDALPSGEQLGYNRQAFRPASCVKAAHWVSGDG